MSPGSPSEEFGPYLVYEQLGAGGMAQVHRAVHATSEVKRPVALKRMLSHIASNEEMVKSFVREARLASYLRHENVAQTYDLGRVGNVYFIVMELITGRNLREVLRHCGATTGPMPVPIALNILNQICDALDYAHNLRDETGQPLGIIHRDVSPSNVIVSESGVVKLIDFGIAKASGAGMQTMSGALKGKFGYMAPEYLGGHIDARADLFAVGVIAHELLTNRPLFSSRNDIQTLTRLRSMQIEPPSKTNPQVPPDIDDVVMTALQRDPDRRWQHATALRTALTTLTHRLGLVATNAQVIQWLAWAFSLPRRVPGQAEPDTEPDRRAPSEPSISIEQHTVEQSAAASSQKMTLFLRDGQPDPPTKTPLGTPAYVRAQRPSQAGHAVAPHVGASPEVPAPIRPSGPLAPVPESSVPPPLASATPRPHPASVPPPSVTPARTHLASVPPPVSVQPHRTHPASVPPPIAATATATARARPISVAPPSPATVTARPHPSSIPPPNAAPSPAVPRAHSGPFAAPRPSQPTPAQPAVVRELAERMGGPEPRPSSGTSPALTAVLILLAAAVAATAVYFVLPLLT